MQGHRGSSVGSLPESLNFNHGSSSSNAAVDQQIYWNSVQNPAENQMSLLSPSNTNITTCVDSVSHDPQNWSRWTLGEPSSSNDTIPQNCSLSDGFVSHEDNSNQVINKSNGSENALNQSASDPDTSPVSRNIGVLFERGDERGGSSSDGRRASCKRKAIERNGTQSSLSVSSSYAQHTENETVGSTSIAAPTQVNPRLGLGFESEDSHRNFRLRVNPSNQQDSSVSSTQQAGTPFPVESIMEFWSGSATDDINSERQPFEVHFPSLAPNMQSFRWSGGSSSRMGGSSSSMGDRPVMSRVQRSSRSTTRNTNENPIAATELRSLVQNQTNNRSLAGENVSASQSGLNSGVGSSSLSAEWADRLSSQYPRRLSSEYVRRQLLASSGYESGGQRSNYSPLRSVPTSPDVRLSSGAGHHGQLNLRGPSWMERHGDRGLGLPYALRTLADVGEGSGNNRLVSEHIRNVLGIMRRAESLRFEDVMILDQSMFSGVADIHDRHRDMRLDVDNMSYEELLALEERIGNVNIGLTEETILSRLKQRKYSTSEGPQVETEPCCICQEEYNDEEELGTLECGHDFHGECIKQWLMHKNLCPICKTTAMAT